MLPLFSPPLFGSEQEERQILLRSLPPPLPHTYNVTTVVTPTSTQTIYHQGVCSAGNYRVWWWCTPKAENVVSLLCAERRLQRNGGMRGGAGVGLDMGSAELPVLFSFPARLYFQLPFSFAENRGESIVVH